MPYAQADDGVRLYFEETGSGRPVVFVHEFAGDLRSWEGQLRHFGQRYRAIAFNARGYPPSDVPEEVAAYSQAQAADDILAVVRHLGIEAAHIVGLSMGGYGAEPDQRERFRAEAAETARFIETHGMEAYAAKCAQAPSRVQLGNKDPRGQAEFVRMLGEHSAQGAARTQLGVQRGRPSLYDLVEDMKRLRMPVLVVTGDEDWPCLQPGILLKRNIASAGLAVMPNRGHAVNLEAPDEFNRIVGDFLAQVDAGRWPLRDPRTVGGSITGI